MKRYLRSLPPHTRTLHSLAEYGDPAPLCELRAVLSRRGAFLLHYPLALLVKRLMSPECHAEYPHSRTRRLIGNVRIVAVDGELITVAANFVCHRYRRHERIREYTGAYRYILKREGELRIKERRVFIDAHELGSLGSLSFIL